jgi:hypothetical protein
MRCEGPVLRGQARLSRRSEKQSEEAVKSRLVLRFMWKGNVTRIADDRTNGGDRRSSMNQGQLTRISHRFIADCGDDRQEKCWKGRHFMA